MDEGDISGVGEKIPIADAKTVQGSHQCTYY